ncbi:flagellar filament capping protein FliD, partial [bacterium]|nr:flagellar filament capping protein FliD [candidate division CSSED10-310 bacterium]
MAVSSASEINEYISQVIALEREPIDELETDKATLSRQNSALQEIDTSLETLQSKLNALTNKNVFLSKSASTTDSNVATASAGTNAVQTTYQVQVVQLAQVAKITSSQTLGLAEGTYAVLQSGEEINASGGSSVTANPNVTFASGTAAVGFDMDKTVVSGTFKVNGQLISVTGSDTIFTVLSKINSASAGVTATFDDENDKIVLTTSSTGPDQTIELTEDNAGFFDAVKLTETNGNPAPVFTDGTNAGMYTTLDDTALVSGSAKMVDGYFTINNITFSIDTSSDSLYSVINRINNSKADVSVYYDEITDKITFSSKTTGEDIYFQNDTSNFLKTLNVLDSGTDLDGTTGESHYQGTSAQVIINGETLTRDGNSFSIGGTTFTLRSTGTANVSVIQDNQSAITAVKGFVDQFNNTMSLIDSKMRTTLKNDRTLMNLKRQLQQKI